MSPQKSKARLIWLAVVVLIVFGGYIYRLMEVQIVQGEAYLSQAQAGVVQQQVIKAARGEIVDRYGRPLAVNRSGYNIVLDGAFLPKGSDTNTVLRSLIELMEEQNEQWIDLLPISNDMPFSYIDGLDTEVAQLKTQFEVNQYTESEDIMHWITQRYQLGQYDSKSGMYVYTDEDTGLQTEYTPDMMRKIAGVRYGMDLQEFGLTISYTFAEDIGINTVAAVEERNFQLPGVSVGTSAIREYVSGDIAPHIIGQVGQIYREEYEELKNQGYRMDAIVGKEGVELAFESYLRGEDGVRQITLDSSGAVVSAEVTKPAVPGNTVVLTIDRDLQKVAQEALEAQIKNLQETAQEGMGKEANAGAVVVIENSTGDILAAATYPSYDINDYRTEYSSLLADPSNPLWNRALLGTYAAGSTFKPAVTIAGMTEEVVSHNERITCSGVYTGLGDSYQPGCLGVHGALTAQQALQVSCNIYFYETGNRLGIDNLNLYASQLGLGQPTGIEIAEATGQLSSPEIKELVEPGAPWYPADTVQSSIGQLYNQFTPLQLANYVATIGNQGERMDVNIVDAVKSYTMDETVWENTPTVAQYVQASDEALDITVEGMELATAPGGTSYFVWGDYPMTIASKTGTPETSAYPNSTYICYGPSEDPEISVAVVIEKGWHGYTGAPVAKAIFDAYFFSSQDQDAPQNLGELLQ